MCSGCSGQQVVITCYLRGEGPVDLGTQANIALYRRCVSLGDGRVEENKGRKRKALQKAQVGRRPHRRRPRCRRTASNATWNPAMMSLFGNTDANDHMGASTAYHFVFNVHPSTSSCCQSRRFHSNSLHLRDHCMRPCHLFRRHNPFHRPNNWALAMSWAASTLVPSPSSR